MGGQWEKNLAFLKNKSFNGAYLESYSDWMGKGGAVWGVRCSHMVGGWGDLKWAVRSRHLCGPGLHSRARRDKSYMPPGTGFPGTVLWKYRVLGGISSVACECVSKPWCMLSCLLTLTLDLHSPFLLLCKKYFLEFVTSLFQCSYGSQQHSSEKSALSHDFRGSGPLVGQLSFMLGEERECSYQSLKFSSPGWVTEGLEYLGFPRCMWECFSEGCGKDISSLCISSNHLSVWYLKEVGGWDRESNRVFLVDFLVVMWTNIFYQSLQYLTSEDLGQEVT